MRQQLKRHTRLRSCCLDAFGNWKHLWDAQTGASPLCLRCPLMHNAYLRRLTAGPKKHALELLRKKIEIQNEKVASVRAKHTVAKAVRVCLCVCWREGRYI